MWAISALCSISKLSRFPSSHITATFSQVHIIFRLIFSDLVSVHDAFPLRPIQTTWYGPNLFVTPALLLQTWGWVCCPTTPHLQANLRLLVPLQGALWAAGLGLPLTGELVLWTRPAPPWSWAGPGQPGPTGWRGVGRACSPHVAFRAPTLSLKTNWSLFTLFDGAKEGSKPVVSSVQCCLTASFHVSIQFFNHV